MCRRDVAISAELASGCPRSLSSYILIRAAVTNKCSHMVIILIKQENRLEEDDEEENKQLFSAFFVNHVN